MPTRTRRPRPSTSPSTWPRRPPDEATPCDCPHGRQHTAGGAGGQRKSPAGLRPPGLSAVREGGVEPPRPCGHWNLNPARLPIPPPAHWVCLRAVSPWGWRLPTPRTLARGQGWVHIPYRGAAAHQGRRHPAPTHRSSGYVSTRVCSRINLVPVPPVSPGAGRGPQSGAGHLSAAASTILDRTESAGGVRRGAPQGTSEASTPVDEADRGNQPIDRRVDTISKQYQVRQYPLCGVQDGSSYGGGAPWES